MSKEVVINTTRCTLVLDEPDLMACIASKPEIFKRAVGRGKGLLRNEAARRREDRDFNRWMLYETFKGTMPIDDITIQQVERMDVRELREGVIEYLLVKKRGEAI